MNTHSMIITWAPGIAQPFACDDSLAVAALVADLVALLRAEGYSWPSDPSLCALFRRTAAGYQLLAPEQVLGTLALAEAEALFLALRDAPWMSDLPPPGSPPASCRIALATGCQLEVHAVETVLSRSLLLEQLRRVGHDPRDPRLRRVSRERHCDLLRDGEAWFVLPTATTYLGGRRLALGQAVALPAGRSDLLLGTEGWPVELERR